MLTKKPTLQGPFNLKNSDAGRSNERDATDICTPNHATPVIAISYTNGDIDYLIFTFHSDTMHVEFAPSWSDDDHYLKPTLTLIETVSIGGNSNNKMSLSMLPDPLNLHCIYAVDRNSSACYMILSQMILDAANGDENNSNKMPVTSLQVPIYKNDDDVNKICSGIIIAFDPLIGNLNLFLSF